MAAFTSRSCSAPQLSHVQRRTLSPAWPAGIRPVRAPHDEQDRVLGYDRGATHTSPAASRTLTPTRSRSRAIAASATAPANRVPRSIPRTDRSSTPTRAAVLATDVDAVSVACRLTAATRAWSRASLTTAFRRFADPAALATDGPARTPHPSRQRRRAARIPEPLQHPAVHRRQNREGLHADVEPGAARRRRTPTPFPIETDRQIPRVSLPRDPHRLDLAAPADALRHPDPTQLRHPHPATVEPHVLIGEPERPRVALRHRPARQPRPASRPRLAQRPRL